MILQRKMFAESKDEIALVLFGTPETDNQLADGESYENITVQRPMGLADFELLQMVQNDIQPSDTSADFIDAMIVALDHLEKTMQGKKGFAARRLILLSDLAGKFGDDQLDTMITAIQNNNTEINVIGPDLDDDDDDGDEPEGSHKKEKTPQQRAGEAMVKYILENVTGGSYSFSEALPALSYFQSRQVRPTAWKAQLEIGADLKIPVNGYIKVKDFKLRQSWKKVYARDPELVVKTERTFHVNDEEETEVEKEDIVEGYCYGSDRVPMTAEDKESMRFQTEKCLKVLGFTKAEFVKRHHYLGDSCLSISAEKGDEAAAVALSALINALYETNCVAIARRVYQARSAPRIGCLVPHIKAAYECLYWMELPFSEDLRTYTFGSLPLKPESTTNKKYAPTAEQLAAVDKLITSMDLSTAEEDEDGEKSEAMKPKLTFNPYFQRVYQCLQHRALNPDDPIPELSSLIARSLQRPQVVETACQGDLEQVKKLFKLETVAKKKEQQTGDAMFKENGSGEGPAAKRPKTDDDLAGGIEGMTKAKVTEVGTVTPIEDFKDMISRKDEDLFDQACKQMQQRVQQNVTDSFGPQFYGKAMDCLKELRLQCVKKSEAKIYNTFIREFKGTLIGKGRRDFWDRIVEAKQGLISKPECEDSSITKQEAETFLAGEVKKEEAAPQKEEETTDDLLMDL